MLKVKTYLDRSAIHGIGLFASGVIAPSQEVWAFNPKVDLVIELDAWQEMAKELAESSFEQVQQLAYKEEGKMYICVDNAQFMNHSTTAANIANLKDGNIMVATREILPGEELICNYFEFCDQDDSGLQAMRMGAE